MYLISCLLIASLRWQTGFLGEFFAFPIDYHVDRWNSHWPLHLFRWRIKHWVCLLLVFVPSSPTNEVRRHTVVHSSVRLCVHPINYRENRWGYFTEIWSEDTYGQYDQLFFLIFGIRRIFRLPDGHLENQADGRAAGYQQFCVCSLKLQDFFMKFAWVMYQGTKVCRAKELCRCDLWPWPCDLETKIPFRSVSPKRMKIFGWYLVWGCIRIQRCVRQNICVDVTFDLDPVTMTPNCIIIHFRSIIPKRLKIFGWYLVGGCIRGQRFVARKNCVDATFDLDCDLETEIPFRSVTP
jgi:hypothetical protein